MRGYRGPGLAGRLLAPVFGGRLMLVLAVLMLGALTFITLSTAVAKVRHRVDAALTAADSGHLVR